MKTTTPIVDVMVRRMSRAENTVADFACYRDGQLIGYSRIMLDGPDGEVLNKESKKASAKFRVEAESLFRIEAYLVPMRLADCGDAWEATT